MSFYTLDGTQLYFVGSHQIVETFNLCTHPTLGGSLFSPWTAVVKKDTRRMNGLTISEMKKKRRDVFFCVSTWETVDPDDTFDPKTSLRLLRLDSGCIPTTTLRARLAQVPSNKYMKPKKFVVNLEFVPIFVASLFEGQKKV